jgi:uncharacterized protein YeaO (DUF488 family)
MIRIKRVYEEAESGDGARFLVDRLWPRGVKKSSLNLTAWLPNVAPSNDLRRWYHHELTLWDEFRRRYFSELVKNPEAWHPLIEAIQQGSVTLLYSSQQLEHNNAVALKEFLNDRLPTEKKGRQTVPLRPSKRR